MSDKNNLSNAGILNLKKENYLKKIEDVGILAEKNEDIRSLKEMITYGLKGLVAFEGCRHIEGEKKDFSQVIEMAKKCLPPKEIEQGEIIGGFAHKLPKFQMI